MAKSEAEVAARIVQGWALNDANDRRAREALEGRIESALSTAQSNLAKSVLAEIAAVHVYEDGKRYGKDVKADAFKRLRDLFTRLGVKVEGKDAS